MIRIQQGRRLGLLTAESARPPLMLPSRTPPAGTRPPETQWAAASRVRILLQASALAPMPSLPKPRQKAQTMGGELADYIVGLPK
jgi:hypothetical protein